MSVLTDISTTTIIFSGIYTALTALSIYTGSPFPDDFYTQEPTRLTGTNALLHEFTMAIFVLATIPFLIVPSLVFGFLSSLILPQVVSLSTAAATEYGVVVGIIVAAFILVEGDVPGGIMFQHLARADETVLKKFCTFGFFSMLLSLGFGVAVFGASLSVVAVSMSAVPGIVYGIGDWATVRYEWIEYGDSNEENTGLPSASWG